MEGDPDASPFAYPLAPRFVTVQWDLRSPYLPGNDEADYVALWQQAQDRSPAQQLAGATEQQLLDTRYPPGPICAYANAQGDRGAIYATSTQPAPGVGTASSSSALAVPYGSLQTTLRAYVGVLSLWSVGALLLVALRVPRAGWPLAIALALPTGCLAAAVELSSLSLLHVNWSGLAIAAPWFVLALALAVQRRAWRAARPAARPVRLPAFAPLDWIALAVFLVFIGILFALAPFALPSNDGFSAGYSKARMFWAARSLVPFYEHASGLFYAQPAHPPLVALVLNWLYMVTGRIDEHATLILWPALLASLLLALYAFLRRTMSRGAAGLCVVGVAVAAWDVTITSLRFGYADLPLAVFLLGGVSAVWVWSRRPTRCRGLLLGGIALLAAAAWTKEEGVVAGPGILLIVSVLTWSRRSTLGRLWWMAPAAAAFIYGVLLLPLFALRLSYPVPEVIVHAATLNELVNRMPPVIVGFVLRMVQHWFLPAALLGLVLLQVRPGRRAIRPILTTGLIIPLVAICVQLLADIMGILFNPFEVYGELAVTAGRLLSQLSPIVYLVAIGVWAMSSRTTSSTIETSAAIRHRRVEDLPGKVMRSVS
jgi:hypothetical protein